MKPVFEMNSFQIRDSGLVGSSSIQTKEGGKTRQRFTVSNGSRSKIKGCIFSGHFNKNTKGKKSGMAQEKNGLGAFFIRM